MTLALAGVRAGVDYRCSDHESESSAQRLRIRDEVVLRHLNLASEI